jgi:Superinfection immunity protein
MVLADSVTTGAIIIFVLYFLPTVIGLVRGVRNIGSVIVINVLLGWTVIGWIVALAMAVRSVDRTKATPGTPTPAAAIGTRECPFCKEEMRRDASVCPHCRRESAAWKLNDGVWWTQVDGVWYQLNEANREWVKYEKPADELAPAPE